MILLIVTITAFIILGLGMMKVSARAETVSIDVSDAAADMPRPGRVSRDIGARR